MGLLGHFLRVFVFSGQSARHNGKQGRLPRTQ
jgi:hypothetical protein